MKKYKIVYIQNGLEKKQIIQTNSLEKESLPKNIISLKEIKFSLNTNLKKTLNSKELSLIFYELNTMLQSNITFNDALNILIKNKKDENSINFLEKLQFCFSNSKPVDEVLKEYNLDKIVISFLQISQKSGNIKDNIFALSLLLQESITTKKLFLKAISYPIVLLLSFIFSLFTIFYFVIPKFKTMFAQFGDTLPVATKILFKVEYFINNYAIFFFIGFILILMINWYFYKSSEKYAHKVHRFLIKDFSFFKNVFLYIELYRLFFMLNILLKNSYEFHKALNLSKILLKNKYLFGKISFIENLLQKGKPISVSFEKSKIFDDIVISLLNTGEVSNSLVEITKEIKKIYKNRFDEIVNKITNLLQPIFLVLIVALILWIILAIFVPIWDMGSILKT